MMISRKNLALIFQRDWAWCVAFCFSVIFFYPELFFVKAAPLVNDHWEQHYPWAYLLHKTLQQGGLPFWTPLIHCGFPIASESQIGVFYLPNLLLSLLFPFPASYAFTMLIHFMISGVGTGFYARSIGLSRPAAWFAAVLFVFGTSYGGAYYNITSLKTLTWFPWLLWIFEMWVKKRKAGWMVLWGVIASQLLVAGYLQVGTLVIGMACICAGVRLIWIRQPGEFSGFWRSRWIWLVGALGLCVLLSLGQVLLTLPLALLSNRTGLVEEYAYVGSLSPLALFTLLLPNLQGLFRGNCLYSGMFAFFAMLAAFLSPDARRSQAFRLWAVMAAISLLLALGRWSPLYVAIIKLTHFSSFRTPSKFLIFFNFSTCLLAACGFQALMDVKRQTDQFTARAVKGFLMVLAGVLFFSAAVKSLLLWGQPFMIRIGEFFLRMTIYGHAGHPHSYETYLGKLDSMLKTANEVFSFGYHWTVWMACVFFGYVLWALMGWRSQWKSRAWLMAGLLLLGVDLYGFSHADVRTDFAPLPVQVKNSVIQVLKKASLGGTLGRVYVFKSRERVPELMTSANMLFDIPTIGAYSPLVMGRYFQTVGRFGGVNDSNQEFIPDEDFVLQRLELLNALGVTHVFSSEELRHTDLSLIWTDGQPGAYLYELRASLPVGGFLVGKLEVFSNWAGLKARVMEEHFDPRKSLLLENAETLPVGAGILMDHPAPNGEILSSVLKDDRASFEVETPTPAFFVRPVTFFTGWKALVNASPAKIFAAYGLFQAVWLPEPGRYTLEFEYDPGLALREALRTEKA